MTAFFHLPEKPISMSALSFCIEIMAFESTFDVPPEAIWRFSEDGSTLRIGIETPPDFEGEPWPVFVTLEKFLNDGNGFRPYGRQTRSWDAATWHDILDIACRPRPIMIAVFRKGN